MPRRHRASSVFSPGSQFLLIPFPAEHLRVQAEPSIQFGQTVAVLSKLKGVVEMGSKETLLRETLSNDNVEATRSPLEAAVIEFEQAPAINAFRPRRESTPHHRGHRRRNFGPYGVAQTR